MKKQKFFTFLKKVLFSSAFLWVFLVILKSFNLKPEIRISFFFFLSLLLFVLIYLRQILVFLILTLNKINLFLKISNKRVKIESENFLYLFSLFIRKLLKFFKGFPRFLKFILTNYFFWLGLCILGILIDIFVFKFTSDLLILFLTGLWILIIRHYKFEGRVSIAIALFFLTLCPFLLIFKKEPIAEKAAIWAYMFLVVGVIQLFINELKD